MKKFAFLFLMAYACCMVMAQEEVVSEKKPSFFKRIFKEKAITHDTSYFRLEQNKLLLRGYGKQKYNGFNLYVPDYEYFAKYSKMPENNLGIGFNYKWIGLNFGYAFPFINKKSKSTKDHLKIDLQLQLLVSNWIFDGSLQHLQGYYLRETSLGNEYNLSKNPKILFDALSVNALYVYNHKRYSYKASYINNAVQKKSAGSLMMGATLYYYKFQTDDNLYPDISLPTNDTLFVEYNKVESMNAFFVIGYGYTVVLFKKMYINATFTPGIGFGNSKFEFGEKKWNRRTPAYEGIIRAAIGYNTDHFFVALSGMFIGIHKELPNGFHWNYAGNIRLSAGVKLNVQKKNKK